MKKKLFFEINGENYFICKTITLMELMCYFDYDLSLLVLEYNSVICSKKDWENVCLKSFDRIEILTIVGGG